MAGIYIHIPFCRRACHYCDFHFTTNLTRSEELVDAILLEIALRKDYLEKENVSTIYFGGGTPSLLPSSALHAILNKIRETQTVSEQAEITLEANPEDLSEQKLNELKALGINRLSLGTQSFIDAELKWMNRMHTAAQACKSIDVAQSIGFNNISVDLIFGLPNQTEEDWQFNLQKVISLGIQHISSYALTIEEKTVLNNRIQKGLEKHPDDQCVSRFLEMNMQFLSDNGFEQYEISNFAKPGCISKHNSSYWQHVNYLGLGPSAHSFNAVSRQWNVRSNAAYIANLNQGKAFFEKEHLSTTDRLNEHILTGLRTKWGIQKSMLENIEAGSWVKMKQQISTEDQSFFNLQDDTLTLTETGKFMADGLSSKLFFI